MQYFREHARFYPDPALHGLARMRPSGCFQNCSDKLWELRDPGLRYVQGLVAEPIRIVYPHAWLSDAAGHCIELTWDLYEFDGTSRDLGVPLTLERLPFCRRSGARSTGTRGSARSLVLGNNARTRLWLKSDFA